MASPEFIKIPKALFTIKPSTARLYAAYVDFKAFNPEGHICPPFKVKSNRHYYRYWGKKLISAGWATMEGCCISLRAYPHVWRTLGVNQSRNKKNGLSKFAYHKVEILDIPESRKDYFKYLTEKILTKVAGNKQKQIKWRLNNMQDSKGVDSTETFMSCRKVAKLFGLKSSASGNKYRNKYFDVIKEPTMRKVGRNTHHFRCKRIAL